MAPLDPTGPAGSLLTPEQRRRYARPPVEQRYCHERWLLREFPALAELSRLERERLLLPAFDAKLRLEWAAWGSLAMGIAILAGAVLGRALDVWPLQSAAIGFLAAGVSLEPLRRWRVRRAAGRRLLALERDRGGVAPAASQDDGAARPRRST